MINDNINSLSSSIKNTLYFAHPSLKLTPKCEFYFARAFDKTALQKLNKNFQKSFQHDLLGTKNWTDHFL